MDTQMCIYTFHYILCFDSGGGERAGHAKRSALQSREGKERKSKKQQYCGCADEAGGGKDDYLAKGRNPPCSNYGVFVQVRAKRNHFVFFGGDATGKRVSLQ